MKAYKFLLAGAVGPFSGVPWPVPDERDGRPGPWVEAVAGERRRCRGAVHACRLEDLPWWIGEELWEVELAEPACHVRHKLIAPRGRLLRRLVVWDRAAARAFGQACADEAARWARVGRDAGEDSELARVSATMAADARTRARQGHASTAGYIAAHAARHVGGPPAMVAERRRQAAWFAARLRLSR
jgi:hypothetical protein